MTKEAVTPPTQSYEELRTALRALSDTMNCDVEGRSITQEVKSDPIAIPYFAKQEIERLRTGMYAILNIVYEQPQDGIVDIILDSLGGFPLQAHYKEEGVQGLELAKVLLKKAHSGQQKEKQLQQEQTVMYQQAVKDMLIHTYQIAECSADELIAQYVTPMLKKSPQNIMKMQIEEVITTYILKTEG